MKVPFRLHKLEYPGAATALLLLSQQSADLLALCVRIAAEAPEATREWPALPPIHAVAGGFLVKLGQPVAAIFPGVIRLRSLAANLFLPVDAELVPALLSDEAAGLVRERGLIFLPGGRVLAFALDPTITADMLLTLPRLPGREWSALPARPARPERLESILLDLPDEGAEQILAEGGENIGVEAPRPADSGPIARAAGKAALGAGKGLAWLGTMLHWPGLAKLGASLAAGAMRAVPRLSEALVGRQEAALRELLRKFRAGNLEEALRQALPLANPSGRGDRPAADATLPTHRLIFRLIDLLSSARGASSQWFGPADVQAELRREYHNAANAALARGDYRRAAFIYGRLLQDYRSAAKVLWHGGLYHDAAIIYLELVGDRLMAAQAFEAAGETDRALQLYEQCGKYSLAGDLLRRLGEEEEAVRYYLRAAEELAAGDNHLAAADLLFARAQRPDLALPYLKAGWARRPRGSALPCLLRLTQWHAEQDEPSRLLALVAEAEEYFAPPGNEHAAGQFFNTLARLADHANLSSLRDDLRDRALCGLAGKLRPHIETHARPGVAVSELFGHSGVWKAAVVSDAEFALKAAFKKKALPPKKETAITGQRVHFGWGHVSAVCCARASGRVFLGFVNGGIGWFDPYSELVLRIPVPRQQSTIVSLATNDRGDRLVALSIEEEQQRFLSSFNVSEKGFDSPVRQPVSCCGPSWLTPILTVGPSSRVGFWNGEHLAIFWNSNLLAFEQITVSNADEVPRSALLLRNDFPGTMMGQFSEEMAACLFLGDTMLIFDKEGEGVTELHLGWRPGSQLRGLCSPPPLSWHWRRSGPLPLELVGVDEDDSVHWTELDHSDPVKPKVTGGASTQQKGYRVAALVHSGLIAGVYDGGVDWLRRQEHRLLPTSATLVRLEDAVACVMSPPTRELLVVCRNGSLVRVPLPT